MLPCTASRLTMVCSKRRTIWYLGGGGGGAKVCFFLPPVGNKFFFGDQRPTIFFYVSLKKFFVICFPYYVRYRLVFFVFNIFFINFDNILFFCPHFQQTFFFWLLWRQTIFFNFNLAPPPQISNGASLNTKQLQNTLVLLTQFLTSISKRNTPITKIVNLNPDI